MSYHVEFTTAAARQMKKLPRPARARVLDAIEDLGDNFDERLTVTVVRAAHRREAYER